MDLPADLVYEPKAKAKKAGMEYDQFISLVLEDGVKKKMRFDEMIRKTVRRVLVEKVERVAPHTKKVLAKFLMTEEEKPSPISS